MCITDGLFVRAAALETNRLSEDILAPPFLVIEVYGIHPPVCTLAGVYAFSVLGMIPLPLKHLLLEVLILSTSSGGRFLSTLILSFVPPLIESYINMHVQAQGKYNI